MTNDERNSNSEFQIARTDPSRRFRRPWFPQTFVERGFSTPRHGGRSQRLRLRATGVRQRTESAFGVAEEPGAKGRNLERDRQNIRFVAATSAAACLRRYRVASRKFGFCRSCFLRHSSFVIRHSQRGTATCSKIF